MKKKKLLKTAMISAAAIGLTWILNKAIFYYSTMREVLTSAHGHLYKWRFGNIYYMKKGEGTPLLLVHHLDCSSSSYEWKYISDELAKEHTVYIIDLLGCGHSDKPKMTYTNYMYVQLLNDFVKEVIKGRTDIMTSGNASSLAVMACHMDTSLYNKLLFINPASLRIAGKIPDFGSKLLKYAMCLPVIGTLVYNLCFSVVAINRRFENKYIYKRENIRKADIDAYHESAHLGGSSSKFLYASILSHFTEANIGRALRATDHSIFIIGGQYADNMDEIIDDYMLLNPAVEVTCIQDSSQLPHVERPEEVVENCRIYL